MRATGKTFRGILTMLNVMARNTEDKRIGLYVTGNIRESEWIYIKIKDIILSYIPEEYLKFNKSRRSIELPNGNTIFIRGLREVQPFRRGIKIHWEVYDA